MVAGVSGLIGVLAPLSVTGDKRKEKENATVQFLSMEANFAMMRINSKSNAMRGCVVQYMEDGEIGVNGPYAPSHVKEAVFSCAIVNVTILIRSSMEKTVLGKAKTAKDAMIIKNAQSMEFGDLGVLGRLAT